MDFDDTGYIFAGVWDGHAGVNCSEFVDQNVFEMFRKYMRATKDAGVAQG